MTLSSTDQIDLLSVGIDVGSSTSHLIFSNLTLMKNMKSATRRYEVVEREVIYESKIIDTPLVDKNTIDMDQLTKFLKQEYVNAGISFDEINTGAVIVTGETAKKQNAQDIVSSLSRDAGKFVSAAAGPNFESLIAAMGSGVTTRSKELQNTILSVDIGGGTSNLAISSNGEIISTSCISVGGRLIAFDARENISRIDEPAQIVLDHLGINVRQGDTITGEELDLISGTFANLLIEVMNGPAESELAKKLILTSDLNFPEKIDEISFSGGVAEFIYGGKDNYNDIGFTLANKIVKLFPLLKSKIIEPENKIRATVIGAGAYSLSISGSTSFLDPELNFPIKNLPIIRVDIDRNKLSISHVKEEISKSYSRFDLKEGEDIVALYFKDPVRASYNRLKLFAQAIEESLPQSINNGIPIVLIFVKDIANSVGNIIRRETKIKEKLLSIDELDLQEGDWIDIGKPLVNGQVFPVTVKSLIFQNNH